MRRGDVLAGRFEIEHEGGSGGMGEIFRARDRSTGGAVAVKVLLAHPDRSAPARFAHEASVLAELSHPGIVRYIEHGQMPGGEPYLVMEWIEGEDLKRRLDRAPLTLAESVVLGARVAAALGAAHSRGIVHRDLKPSNVFLPHGRVDQAKLLDFGIAWRAGNTNLTHTEGMIGTVGYMAPEQARGGSGIDARTDVFSLGCVLFRCLTGEVPFAGDSAVAVLAKILCDEAPRVSTRRLDVPPALDALVAQMLLKDADGRPRDGDAVAAALDALGSVLSEEAPPLGHRPVQTALTGSERWVRSVVLMARGASAEEKTSSHESAPADGALLQTAERYNGHLQRLVGGSILVTFARERRVSTDQAAQAARCALALRESYPDRPMALATGRADLGAAPATGNVIDRAAGRLLQLAAGALSGAAAPIALDEISAGLLDARFEVSENEAGYALLGEREIGTSARLLLGKPTSCVGREAELASLEAMLAATVNESSARAVLVTAAAGMGKSRLASEFLNRVRRHDMPVAVWIARGDPLRAGSTLDMIAQALRGALGIHEGEPLSARRDTLRARVSERVPAADHRRVAEFLGELSGTPFADEDSTPLRAARRDAQLMRSQTSRALTDFLHAETHAHPVLLVLEDLHWGDVGTVRLINTALRELADSPWMVLALTRPDVHDRFPRLWAERHIQEIRLKELSRTAASRLVRQVLGDDLGTATVERLVKLADGNAFYLEELIRSVAEGRGAALPETVLAMVEARLGRLEGEARRVLRAASVFGEVCWESAVASLLGGAMAPGQVGEWLSLLVEREVMVRRPESRFPGEQELTFRHALLCDGAHAMLTEEDERRGHLLAGEWLERHGESDAVVLAQHFERGLDEMRAARFYRAAAAQALRAGDIDGAIARAERAIAARVERVACLGLLCEAYQWCDDGTRALPYADELMRLAAPGTEPWIHALETKQIAAMIRGHGEQLLDVVRALTTVEAAPDLVGVLVPALTTSVRLLSLVAKLGPASDVLARIVEMVEATRTDDPILRGAVELSRAWVAAWAEGNSWAALRHARAAEACSREARDTRHTGMAQLVVGMSLWSLGLFAEAEATLRAIGALSGDDLVAVLTARYLAIVLVERGALDEARALAERRIELGRVRPEHSGKMRQAEGRWLLGEVAARAGDLEAAEHELTASLAPGALTALAWQVAAARLVDVRLATGRVAEALELARELWAAFRAAGGSGMRGMLVRLVHAEALDAAGERAAAHEALREAWSELRERSERIDDDAVRQTFLEVVPEHARVIERARQWLGLVLR
jgi:tetratricopeptide (TPR) repeat protein